MGIKSPSAYLNMGTVYLETGDFKTAIGWFLKAAEKDPGSASALAFVNAGFAYGDLGEYRKAIEMHQKALSVNPYHYTAHFGLGLAYEGAGQFKEAEPHWNEYIRSAPDADEWKKEADRHLRRIREMRP